MFSGRHTGALRPIRPGWTAPDETEVVEVIDSDLLISVDEMKKSLGLKLNVYDARLTRIIKGVTSQIERYLRLDLQRKKLRSVWVSVPPEAILPRGPHQSIESVKLVDFDGEETELTLNTDYKVKGSKRKTIVGASFSMTWPSNTNYMAVEYTSGYEPDKVPVEAIDAIDQEVNLQYKNKQDPDTAPMTSVDNLSLEARHLLTGLVRRDL